MKSAEKCPSFTVISTAADGDTQAIEKILKHMTLISRKPACARCTTNTVIST